MRMMISGSREHTDYEFIRDMVEDAAGTHFDITFIHGAARGADKLGAKAAEEYGFTIESFPADWSLGKRAGGLRNSEMLASGVDIALFFFLSSHQNVGTRDAARKAISLGITSRYFIDDQEYTLAEIKRKIIPF